MWKVTYWSLPLAGSEEHRCVRRGSASVFLHKYSFMTPSRSLHLLLFTEMIFAHLSQPAHGQGQDRVSLSNFIKCYTFLSFVPSLSLSLSLFLFYILPILLPFPRTHVQYLSWKHTFKLTEHYSGFYKQVNLPKEVTLGDT